MSITRTVFRDFIFRDCLKGTVLETFLETVCICFLVLAWMSLIWLDELVYIDIRTSNDYESLYAMDTKATQSIYILF